MDENTSEDPILTADRFITLTCTSRAVAGVQSPSHTAGTGILDPPHRWVLRGFCKTVSADDPILAHLLVSHIVSAWQIVGLVDTIRR